MSAAGVQVIGVQLQAVAGNHERPRNPRGLKPEQSSAGSNGIANE
jgi:hypothetical protein